MAEFDNNKPIYLQIAEVLMDRIVDGTYRADERIPSVREYAAQVEVNFNTVARSFEWLQNRELIYNKRGVGYFVAPQARERILEMRWESFFSTEVDYFFSRLETFGVAPDELENMYFKYLNNK